MSNPRAYIITSTFLPIVGGSEKQALTHCRSLRGRGLEATIVTLRHNRDWLPYEVIEGVPVIRVAGTLLGDREKLLGPLRRLLYIMGLLAMCWVLWQRRHCYDVLHLYHLRSEAFLVALVCRLTGKPLIISLRCIDAGRSVKLHGMPLLLAGSLDPNTSWLQVEERHPSEGDLAVLESLGKPVIWFTSYLLQCIRVVMVILSSRMKSYLASYDFKVPRTQLIPNGVDTVQFHPCDADISILPPLSQQYERAYTVVCVAGLRYEKGIDVLLQAWSLVFRQIPQAHLIIVGQGQLQIQLEHMAQALGIRDSVEFVGLQSDVSAQLHRGSLIVVPSRYEGMSNALLEAMACGLPCVATRVSGSEDVIQPGVNGLLVEPEDYRAMAQAVLTLMHDPVLASNYGHAARVTIEKCYSLDHVTSTYIELYQKVTERG